MPVHKIAKHPIRNFNGISKIKVPEGSVAMRVITLDNTHDVVHLLVSQPVPPGVETEIQILTLTEDTPFSEPEENKVLEYLGSVAWDHGHKLHHVFEIVEYEEEEEDYEVEFEPEYNPPEKEEATKEEAVEDAEDAEVVS